MGNGYIFTCPNCQKEISILIGAGFCFPSLFRKEEGEKRYEVESYLSPSAARKTRELLDDGWVENGNLSWSGRRPYYCPECKTLELRFDFALEKDGRTWSPGNYRCGVCRTRLEPVTPVPGRLFGPAEYIRCRNCGELVKLNDKHRNMEIMKWD